MLTKQYRGIETTVSNLPFKCKISVNGSVIVTDEQWDGRFSYHSVTIHADKLLETASTCLKQLSDVSKIKYTIVAVDDDNKIIKTFR